MGLTDVEWELLREAPDDDAELADHISRTAPRFDEGANWGAIALKLGRKTTRAREGLRIARAVTRVADYVHPEVLVPLLRFPDRGICMFAADTLAAHAYVEALPQLKDAALVQSDDGARRELIECVGILEGIAERSRRAEGAGLLRVPRSIRENAAVAPTSRCSVVGTLP
jgi:hypothetical protein